MSTPSLRPLALVTGASKGIGFELAKRFATNGFDLVVTAHTEALDEAAREFRGLGATVEAVHGDLAEPEGVDQVWRRVWKRVRQDDGDHRRRRDHARLRLVRVRDPRDRAAVRALRLRDVLLCPLPPRGRARATGRPRLTACGAAIRSRRR
jgi:NAD(P)-dependent dehydrogenase (short-subunit alcohol dehydrogenase family)